MSGQVKSNWDYDYSQEAVITKYIYDNFFVNFLDKKRKWTSQLIKDVKNQMDGLDIVSYVNPFMFSGTDVKTQATYINHPTDTFAFELLFDNVKEGWLLNKNLKTVSYGLTWIWEARVNKNVGYNDIYLTEFMLINKQRLLKLLADNGFTSDYLHRVAEFMVAYNVDRIKYGDKFREDINIPDSDISNQISFVRSGFLKENPVNIVIKKSLLLTIIDSVSVYDGVKHKMHDGYTMYNNWDKTRKEKALVKKVY